MRVFLSCVVRCDKLFRSVSRRFSASAIMTESAQVIAQIYNPIKGKIELAARPDDYEFHLEIARSAYADMLHDHDRNVKYEQAIIKAVKNLQRAGKAAHVLDIGAGTGLLSMLAARAGADSVVACEVFNPMAKVCQEVLRVNGLHDRVKLVAKRSTELEVGEGKDLPRKANILVTEIFDTELIGEGAISIFKHAHEHLLETDCIVVPDRGTIYAVPIDSSLIRSWNTFLPVQLPTADGKQQILMPTADQLKCPGTNGVHDMHLAELPKTSYTPLTDPLPVFDFKFGADGDFKMKRKNILGPFPLGMSKDGSRRLRVDGVFMWWDLKMDQEGEIILSCDPSQEHEAWRDHWMQAVYHVPPRKVSKTDEEFHLVAHHDEYSMWFGAYGSEPISEIPSPVCTCGAHAGIPRRRIGELNDPKQIGVWTSVLRNVLDAGHRYIGICGENPILSLAAVIMGAEGVVAFTNDDRMRNLIEELVKTNGYDEGKIQVVEVDKNACKTAGEIKVDAVIGDPFYRNSSLNWHNLRVWYDFSELKKSGIINESTYFRPLKANLYAAAIEFKDLWKIRAPVMDVLGFNIQHFDGVIDGAIRKSDPVVEPHPLWEYPGKALSGAVKVASFNLAEDVEAELEKVHSGVVSFESDGLCNGVALWMTWEYPGRDDELFLISNGPVKPIEPGQNVQWYMNANQDVHLFPEPSKVNHTNYFTYCVKADSSDGSLIFDFNLNG